MKGGELTPPFKLFSFFKKKVVDKETGICYN